jgi:hypothetical protein
MSASEASKRANNGYNKNQWPKNITYSPQCIATNKDIYVIETNHTINVINQMKYRHNEQSTITIRYLDNIDDFHKSAVDLANTWTNQGNKCSRECLKGAMKHFGTYKGSGNVEHFCHEATQQNIGDVNSILLNDVNKSHHTFSQFGLFQHLTQLSSQIGRDLDSQLV